MLHDPYDATGSTTVLGAGDTKPRGDSAADTPRAGARCERVYALPDPFAREVKSEEPIAGAGETERQHAG